MPSEPIVSVRGEAVLEVAPEVALVSVTVIPRDKKRHHAVEALAGRTRTVTRAVEGFGAAVERFRTDPVHVHPEFTEGKPRERVSGYVARQDMQVTVVDFAVVGQLVATLAEQEMAAVNGPSWALRPGSPVYRDARLAAAADASARARDYAGAFGGRVTGLVEVADQGLMLDGQSVGYAAAAARKVPSSWWRKPQPLAEFDFEPAVQTVHAQVEARFTMTAPSLEEG
jgi:uncharacterized protein YggE